MTDTPSPSDTSTPRPAGAKSSQARDGKAWSGRFAKAADPRLETFSASVHFDVKLSRQDVAGSLAHAAMLESRGILSAAELAQIRAGLLQIDAEVAAGTMPLPPSAEDIHMAIEARLFAIAGDVAGKLHTGRSRNDQVATDMLLWMREAILSVRAALLEVRTVLVDRAADEIDVILPGYTHLQRAQPMRLAHHWLAHWEALARDDGRLRDAYARMDRCPLGAGALAGTTLDLDRAHTARALGFAAPAANSLDAVSARDLSLELLSALSIVAIHLSRICEELVLWSSSEFGFIELDDAFSTGSSLMPQKKNPDVAELVRGKSGRVIGSLVSLLVTMKGLPLAYNRDMQEDKEPVFDAVETVRGCLEILAPTLRTLSVERDAMARAASDPLLLATDLAEHLVTRGVPFRTAHHLVGQIVGEAARRGCTIRDLPADVLCAVHPELRVDPATFFASERSLEARTVAGAPSRKNVERAVADARTAHQNVESELRALRASHGMGAA
jgi:argininosuccinate lyase